MDATKRDPGAVVVLNLTGTDANNAPRREICLKCPKYLGTDKVVLTRNQTTTGGQVEVYDQAQGGNKIIFAGAGANNEFDGPTLHTTPKSLYCEGTQKGGAMKDVELKVKFKTGQPADTDSVNFTVLWVEGENGPDIDGKYKDTDSVPQDNHALDNYKKVRLDHTGTLGKGIYFSGPMSLLTRLRQRLDWGLCSSEKSTLRTLNPRSSIRTRCFA